MRAIDTKYRIDGTVTKYDGTPIPNDEPLFLFRAQDKLLPEVLAYYRKLCVRHGAKEKDLERFDRQLQRITDWQITNYTQYPD